MEEKIKIELEELEKFLSFVKSKHEYAEDIFIQIKFLEDLQTQVAQMYDSYGKGFECEFTKLQEKVIDYFDEFIDTLTENLGIILIGMFHHRNRLKTRLEKEPNAQESDSIKQEVQNARKR